MVIVADPDHFYPDPSYLIILANINFVPAFYHEKFFSPKVRILILILSKSRIRPDPDPATSL
jgi:hypothetical protein